jgi:hypothetical protein
MFIKEGKTNVIIHDWTQIDNTNENSFTFDTSIYIPREYYIEVKAKTHTEEIFYNENLRFYFYASSRAKLLLNGTEVNPTETIRVEKRIQYDYKKIEIKEGWNNFVIKLAGIPKSLEDTENEEASLAIRISGSVKLLDSLQFSPAQPK